MQEVGIEYQECTKDALKIKLKITLDILCGDTEEELGCMTLDRAQGKCLGL